MEISSFEEYPSLFSFGQTTQPSSTISFSNPIKPSKLDDPSIQEILNKFLAFDNPIDDETKSQDSSFFFNPLEEDETKPSSIFFNTNNNQQINETDYLYSNNYIPDFNHSGSMSNKQSHFTFDNANAVPALDETMSSTNNNQQINETDYLYSNNYIPDLIHSGSMSNKRSHFTFDNANAVPALDETMSNTNNNQQINETDYLYSNNYIPDLIHSGSMSNKRSHFTFDNANAVPALDGGGVQRRLWVKDRSTAWWDRVNSPDFTEEEFKNAFRMSRATFDMICEELEPVITKKDTMLRLAIPVRQRVAICIWRLATGAALREVSKHFGSGISTCHKLVLEVCAAIRTVLMPKFLHWPDNNKMNDIKKEFEAFSGIPNVGGSIYTTHVPIIAPKVNVAAYFNKRQTERHQKTRYSVTVQGVVDHNGTFTDICVGYPGSMTDDQILEKSALFQRANKGALKDVRVVGHSGYPLMDWVMVPYSHHQNLTWTQHAYNEKVEGVQKIAKEAFIRLKGRWKCLQKRTDIKLQELSIVLGACCVLHNICEIRNEGFNEGLRFDLFDDESIPEFSVRSVNAINDRNQVAQKILHQHP